MQLSKLRAAPGRAYKVPPCAPRRADGRGHRFAADRECSVDRVGSAMNGIILAAVCLAASGLSAEQQAAQPLLLSLGDGTVVLPDDCAGKRADAPSGDVARIDCADGQNRIARTPQESSTSRMSPRWPPLAPVSRAPCGAASRSTGVLPGVQRTNSARLCATRAKPLVSI
jgi:hypothetical protein